MSKAQITKEQARAVEECVKMAMGWRKSISNDALQWLVLLSTHYESLGADELETAPTPEPVAVENITPGWYFTDLKGRVSIVNVQPDTHNRLTVYYQNAAVPLAQSSPNLTWYRAPSPEELMAMCGEEKDKQPPKEPDNWPNFKIQSGTGGSTKAGEGGYAKAYRQIMENKQPPDERTINAKGGIGGEGGRGGNVNFHQSDIPPHVEIAMRVLESHNGGLDLHTTSQVIVRDYLAEQAPQDEPVEDEKPPAVKTCGECENYNHTHQNGDGFGQCMARGGECVVTFNSSFALNCKFATPEKHPEPKVETCGECQNFFDADGMTDWRCKERPGDFRTYPDNTYGATCPLSTPKAKELAVKTCGECRHIIEPGAGAWMSSCYVDYGCRKLEGVITGPNNRRAQYCPHREPKVDKTCENCGHCDVAIFTPDNPACHWHIPCVSYSQWIPKP